MNSANTSSPQIQRIKETRILNSLLEIERKVAEIASQEVVFTEPLITRDNVPIIRRSTINMIQGRHGSHKSRFAELLCSMLLRRNPDLNKSLGFEKVDAEPLIVCYIDTERNNTEEFPMAIQSIKTNAELPLDTEVPEFRHTSLKNINRNERLSAIKIFLNEIRQNSTQPMFVVLDVVTDCIFNFNDPKESMQLLDYIGALCENYETTFLLMIHLNPGSDKPRGHVGTEALNKSSTVMQIGFELGKNREPTELIQIKFKKSRSSKIPDDIPLIFSEENKSLQLADESFVKSILDFRRKKVVVAAVAEKLGSFLQSSLSRQELIDLLIDEFNCSKNTILPRLDEIVKTSFLITNSTGTPCTLKKSGGDGTTAYYELIEMKTAELA